MYMYMRRGKCRGDIHEDRGIEDLQKIVRTVTVS